MFKRKVHTLLLLIWIIMIGVIGCGEEEKNREAKTLPNKSHQVSISATIEEYTIMDGDERKEFCENNYIEISGIVYIDEASFKIGNEYNDEVVVNCAFDNYTNEISQISTGDYVTISGLCSSSFDDSMFLYECEVINLVKAVETEELQLVCGNNNYLADDSSNITVNREVEIVNNTTDDFVTDSSNKMNDSAYISEKNNSDTEEYSNSITDEERNQLAAEEYNNPTIYEESNDYVVEQHSNNNTNEDNSDYVTEEKEKQQNNSVVNYSQGSYAVNDKNGKIHMVGKCTATNGSGKQLMKQPVYFETYEDAENYSIQYHPGQDEDERRCKNCWK